MYIECPHCHHDNEIEGSEHVICKKCEKNFQGFKFSKRKLISGTALVLLGYIGVHTAHDEVKGYADRYPIQAEFAIIDTCVTGSNAMISYGNMNKKREVCICALGKTQEEMSYKDYQEDKGKFSTLLQKYSRSCK